MHVLIVDDQASQRTMFRHLVEDINPSVRVSDIADPVQALLFSQRDPPDMLIIDYRMPKMDGLEFVRRFRRPLSQRDVPIVLVTVVCDQDLRNSALDAGVIDFITKPIRPRETRARIKNILELRQRQQSLKSRAHLLEHQLASGAQDIGQRERELLTRLARVVAMREGNHGNQLKRMARFSGALAEALGLPENEVRLIELAAPLHDIGNVAIPDAILKKPGVLDDEERALMRQHTLLGHDVLSDSNSPFIKAGAEIALCHHECWDGSGYPRGLGGVKIPLFARIVAIADVLDALLSPRPYREAWSFDKAMEYMSEQSGLAFDPEMIKVLQARSEQFNEILRGLPSLDELVRH